MQHPRNSAPSATCRARASLRRARGAAPLLLLLAWASAVAAGAGGVRPSSGAAHRLQEAFVEPWAGCGGLSGPGMEDAAGAVCADGYACARQDQ